MYLAYRLSPGRVLSSLQWVMDFLICNGLGIYLGMKTCEYLSMKVS